VHGSHRSPAPAATRPTGSHPSPSTTHSQPTGMLGGVEWSSPVVQSDGKTITVAVNVNRTPDLCLDYGLPVLRGVVSETATTVSVTVQAFPPSNAVPRPTPAPGTVLGCSAIGHPPVPLSVKLDQPLGNRSLIDGTTDTSQPMLKASTVPAPTYLPAGYVDRGFRWQDATSPNPNQALHDYSGPDGELQVVRGRGPDPFSPYDPLMIIGEVLGHPARLVNGSPSGTCLTWRDSEYWWAVCSVGSAGGAGPLGDGELHRIGNSIR
jgi:hypothetical protein